MNYKDNFSKQAEMYAKYRPHYPENLYRYLFSLLNHTDLAWDVATGNGQVATALAKQFKKVIATDASKAQLEQAKAETNIEYRVAKAENSGLKSDSVDFITVAQAIHWFDFDRFYEEVCRVAKTDALLAVWAYGLLDISPEIDALIRHLYSDILGDTYWDAERKHLDNHYQDIPFPFDFVPSPKFAIQLKWDYSELTGYLNTWSAVQKFIQTNQKNPLDEIVTDLKKLWGEAESKKLMNWDIYLLVGTL